MHYPLDDARVTPGSLKASCDILVDFAILPLLRPRLVSSRFRKGGNDQSSSKVLHEERNGALVSRKSAYRMEDAKMNRKWLLAITLAIFLGPSFSWAQFPTNLTWTTVLKDVGALEGLTGDNNGKFYVADRTANVCRVWEIDTNVNPATATQVGAVNRVGCAPSGLAFNAGGDLFITTAGDAGFIYKLTPGAGAPRQRFMLRESLEPMGSPF